MAFLMNCTNKGCGKRTEPVLSIKDNEVYCGDCGNIIQNVSSFTKVQMKSLGQVQKQPKGAFSIRCDKCKQESMPKLITNALCCNNCNQKLSNISKPFEILIKDAIKKGNEEL